MRTCVLPAALIVGYAVTRPILAQSVERSEQVSVDSQLGIETFPLWSKEEVSAHKTDDLDQPSLTLFRPLASRANGTAVIIAPGGRYKGLSSNLEGRQVADWFAVRGVAAFVLKYRVGDNHPFPEPLLDGQRAVRLVRYLSAELGIRKDRIGLVGFSAGGHLAAMLGTSSGTGTLNSNDPVERMSAKPDFLVLAYAWLNAMEPGSAKWITYCSVTPTVPPQQCKEWQDEYTPARHVTSTTPPTFIYSTTDDSTVPVSSDIEFYNALLATGVSTEMHLFQHGKHGSGLGTGDDVLDSWPLLLEHWLRAEGWLTTEPVRSAEGSDPTKSNAASTAEAHSK